MERGFELPADGCVHIWHVSPTDISSSHVECQLSQDELDRAGRFRFDEDRHRFINSRVALRRILGQYLKTDSADVQFSYNQFGKPELEGSGPDCSLKFNVSHAGVIALIAVTRFSRIGVDVAVVEDLPDVDSLAAMSLSSTELESFRALNSDRQCNLFFNLWTCKEALAKADGRGLSAPLSEFEFAFSGMNACSLRSISRKSAEATRWSVFQFTPMSGYLGAVAVESGEAEIEHFSYSVQTDSA